MSKPTNRTRAVLALAAALATAVVVSIPAGATQLLTETFRNANVTIPADWNAGGTSFTPCLTAGTNTAQTPIPGCDPVAIDSVGSGTLRLTPATNDRTGYALFNRALPTSGGLDITFQQAQYGGGGADGISFFVVDGTTNLTAPGAPGGSLGYSSRNQTEAGVTNGLLGVGLDAHGNFSSTASDGSGCTAAPGQTANRVVLRGPGSGTAGYCYLAASGALTLRDAGSTRVAHTVRIVIDDDSVASRKVKVYYDGSTSPVVETAVPAQLLAVSTFKFGFAAATGGLNDIHEVWGLTVDTVVPVTIRSGEGYWLGGGDGGVFAYGNARFSGSRSGLDNSGTFVGIAPTDTGNGYWLATSNGTVYNHGDAETLTASAAITTSAPIVGIAATPTGNGYWLVASDGGVFAYGDARYLGGLGGQRINAPIVGIAATPSGDGYWLVASDGGVFAYGDAGFFGSAGSLPLVAPIVGIARTPTGNGYWLAARDGGIFAYGSAAFYGSRGGSANNAPMIGMIASPTGNGYWLGGRDGGVFAYGDAGFFGSAGSLPLKSQIVSMAGA